MALASVSATFFVRRQVLQEIRRTGPGTRIPRAEEGGQGWLLFQEQHKNIQTVMVFMLRFLCQKAKRQQNNVKLELTIMNKPTWLNVSKQRPVQKTVLQVTPSIYSRGGRRTHTTKKTKAAFHDKLRVFIFCCSSDQATRIITMTFMHASRFQRCKIRCYSKVGARIG